MASILNLMNSPEPDDTSNHKRLMRDTLVEFMATTLFIYAGTLGAVSTGRRLVGQGESADVSRILPIALSFGITFMALAFSMGHLTGGHMNPAVSLLMYLKRQLSIKKMLCYWFVQFLGAMLGSALLWGSISSVRRLELPNEVTVARPPLYLGSNKLEAPLNQGNGFLLEMMGSFLFFFVIAQTALDKRGIAKTPFPAIPIGFILVIVHIGLIPFTGCGVNPARTFGPSMVTCMASSESCEYVVGPWYWIYWIGPFVASFLVAEVTYWMEDEEEAMSEENAPLKEMPVATKEEEIEFSREVTMAAVDA